jgi:hypothetical protein
MEREGWPGGTGLEDAIVATLEIHTSLMGSFTNQQAINEYASYGVLDGERISYHRAMHLAGRGSFVGLVSTDATPLPSVGAALPGGMSQSAEVYEV